MALPFGRQSPVPAHVHGWLRDYSYMEPTLPSREDRMVITHVGNPFQDNATNRIPHLKPAIAPENGEVNGYVKFRLRKADIQPEEEPASPVRGPYKSLFDEPRGSVSRLQTPRDFGLGCKLDNVDRKLFQFCKLLNGRNSC
jgi:hypothetical protein